MFLSRKKAYKKLKYLEINQLDAFLQGKFNLLSDLMDDYGNYVQMTKASVKENADTEPYREEPFITIKGVVYISLQGMKKQKRLPFSRICWMPCLLQDWEEKNRVVWANLLFIKESYLSSSQPGYRQSGK